MTTNEERREAAKRKLEQRLEAERAQARKRRMMLLSAAGVVALAVIGTAAYFGYRGWDNSRRVNCSYNEAADPFATLPDTLPDNLPAEQRAQYEELFAAYQQGKKQQRTAPKPDDHPLKDGTVSVTFDTNVGALPATLNRAEAPCNVNGVLTLAEHGYYDDVPCHAMAMSKDGGALLCGDPTGTAANQGGAGGNPGWSMPDEPPTNLKVHGEANPLDPTEQMVTYPKGTIAIFNANQADSQMGPGTANTGAGTMYIFLKDTPLLPNYSVIGHVDAAALPVLDTVIAAGIARGPGAPEPKDGQPLEGGVPKNPVIITGVVVDQG